MRSAIVHNLANGPVIRIHCMNMKLALPSTIYLMFCQAALAVGETEKTALRKYTVVGNQSLPAFSAK